MNFSRQQNRSLTMAKKIRHLRDSQTEFTKTLSQICRSWSTWQVWADFVRMAAIAISNAVDHSEVAERREKEYLQIIGKYKKPDQEVFPQLLYATVKALEENPEQDFLGDLFMSLDLGNHWKGQFFTPYHICHMMAEMTMGNAEAEIERKGWIGIEDCCCGGGAMLIAARNALARKKIDWTNHALFVAQDIDVTAAMMCYIQLSLLGCSGYVAVGNTFTDPITGPSRLFPTAHDGLDIWYTPTFYLDVWQYRRIWDSMDMLMKKADHGVKTALDSKPVVEHQETPKAPEMAFAMNSNGQLTLF